MLDDLFVKLPGPVRATLTRPMLRCVAAWGATQVGDLRTALPLAREAVSSVVAALAEVQGDAREALHQMPGGDVVGQVAGALYAVAKDEAPPEVRAIARGTAVFLIAIALELGVTPEQVVSKPDESA